MKNKKGLIIILVIVAVLVLAGGGTTAVLLLKNSGGTGDNGTVQTAAFELAEIQEFSYDGVQKTPIVTNISEEDKQRLSYSYAVKTDENPEGKTYTQGLPTNIGTYYVKVSLDGAYRVATLTIAPANVTLQELAVIYNQPLTLAPGYFTSDFKASDVTFNALFTSADETVDGVVKLDADKLLPNVSTYAYTFTPNDKNFAPYKGSVDISVFAMLSLFKGDELEDYREVKYGSYFDDSDLVKRNGYESPYWADENGNVFTSETKILEDATLYFHEDIITYHITYHLDGGENGENPLTYTVEDENITFNAPSKAGYEFVGWYDSADFDNPFWTVETNTARDYDVYAQFEYIKTKPVVTFDTLDLMYSGAEQPLVHANVQGGTILFRIEDSSYGEDVPTGKDASEYVVYYKVNGDDKHLNLDETSVKVTIEKATFGNIEFADGEFTFDGTAKSIQIGTELPNEITVSYEGNGKTNAGEYTVTAKFTVSDNYNPIADKTATLLINKANPTLTAPTAKTGLVYTGEAQALVNAGSVAGGNVLYSLDNTSYSENIVSASNAGEYVVYFRYEIDTTNYVDPQEEGHLEVSIAKATPQYSAPTAKTGLAYTGEAQELVEAGEISVGRVKYSLNGGEFSMAIPVATASDTYTVEYIFEIDDLANYNAVSGDTLIVEIAKVAPTLTAPTAKEELVFTGYAQNLVNAGSVTGGKLKYSLDGENYDTALPTGMNAGEYTVYFKVDGDENHSSIAPESLLVNIAKATYDMTSVEFANKEAVYDGEAHSIEITGELPAGVNVSYVGGGTDVGEYTIVATFAGDETNFEAISQMTALLTVTKATPTINNPTAVAGLKYTGSAYVLVESGSTTGGTLQYSLDGENYDAELPTGTNAGEYTVYFKVDGGNNYENIPASTIVVNIAKANITKVDPTANALTYTGETQVLIKAGQASAGHLEYALEDGEYSESLPSAIDAGNYTVNFRFVVDGNYEEVEGGSVIVTISKATYDMTAVSFADISVTYDGSEKAVVITGELPVGVSVNYVDNTRTNAGSQTATAHFVGNANYNEIESMTATLTIIKAAATFDLSSVETSFTYTGSVLSISGATATGEVSYESNSFKNAGEYTVRVLSAESENYLAGETSVQVVVNKATFGDIEFADGEFTFDCTAKSIQIGTELPNEITVSYEGNGKTNAGEYTVTAKFTVSDNYNPIADKTATLVINKANPTLTAPTAKEELVFTGSAQNLVNAGSVTGGTLKYSLDGTNYSVALPTGTNAGEYTVFYLVEEDENYNGILANSLEVSIKKASLAGVVVNGYTGIVDGQSHNVVATKAATPVDGSAVVWAFSKDNENWTDALFASTVADSGTYYFKATADNHDDVVGTFEVVVSDKYVATIEIDNIDALSKIYDGEAIANPVVVTDSDGLVTISYSSDGENYISQKPISAGEYRLKVEVTETATYVGVSRSYIIDIAKKDLSLTGISVENKTYDGTNSATVANYGSLVGVVEGDDVLADTTNTIATFEDANVANGKPVTISGYALVGEDKDNYSLAVSWATTANILKANVEFVAPTAKSLTYTGLAHELVNAGTVNTGNIEYNLQETGEYFSEIPTGTNAGEYTVYYRVNVDENNYNAVSAGSVNVTIAKAAIELLAPTAKTGLVYTASAQSLVNAGSVTGGTLKYSLDGVVYGAEAPTGTNAGEYTVYFKVEGDENHSDIAPASILVNIAKASLSAVAPTAKAGLVYSGTNQLLVTEGNMSGAYEIGVYTIEYRLQGGEYGKELPGAVNAGTYTVEYEFTLVDETNYVANGALTGSVSVLVAKAKYDMSGVSFADGEVTYDGNSHGLVISGELPDGVSVSYDKEGRDAGLYSITASFEGDAENFEPIASMQATLTIKKASVTIAAPTANVLAYTGYAQTLVQAGTTTVGSIEYRLGDGEYSAQLPQATNAGNYTVGYKFTIDETNYDVTGKTLAGNVAVTIQKAVYDMSGVTFANGSKVYNGSEQGLTISGTLPTGVSVQYSGSGKNVGEYTIVATFTGDGNHEAIPQKTATLTITKATPALNAPTAKTGLVYTASAQSLVNAGSVTGGTLKYSLDGTNYSVALPQGTNAGEYTVYFRVDGDDNYNGISASSISASIAKASLVATAPVAKTGLVYNGTNQALVTAGTLKSGSQNVGAVEYSLGGTNYSTSIPQGMNVSVYTVYYRFTASDNYDKTGVTMSGSVAVSLAKATVTPTVPTAKTGLTYSGSSQVLVTGGSIANGTIQYNLNGGAYSVAVPTATAAGDYTVGYKFIIDETNYEVNGAMTGTLGVSIAKTTVTVKAPTAKTGLKYTGSAQALVTAGETSVGEVKYSVDGTTYGTAIPTGVNAGTYTVYYRYDFDTTNYVAVSGGNFDVSIEKINPTYTVPQNLDALVGSTLADVQLPSGFTFNDPLTTSVGSEGDNQFVVTYTPSDTTNYNVVTNINVTIRVSTKYRLQIVANDNQQTTYNASAQAPNVTVKANDSVLADGYTLSYAYKLTSASTYTTGLPTNAGTYNVKISASGASYDPATDVVVTYTIAKATLTISNTLVNIAYSADVRTQAAVFSAISSGITYSGVQGADSVTITVSGMHNGKYKYGTVSGSYVAPTSDTIFGGSYTNVIGSTYSAYLTPNNTNYVLSNDNILVKYKTALIGSTYYTIEDAIQNGSGTITFAGDSTSATSYVATTFSSLDTSITGYSTSYTISGRTLIVPYDSSSAAKADDVATTSGYVYAALVVPSGTTLNFAGSSTLTAAAKIYAIGGGICTAASYRGIIVNNGTINMNSGSVNAYGYIKGTGTLNMASGTTLTESMTSYDWPGGSAGSSMYNKVFITNSYSIHNASCTTVINSGVTYSGYLVANIRSSAKTTTVDLVVPASSSSNNYMFKPSGTTGKIIKSCQGQAELSAIVASNQTKTYKDKFEIFGTWADGILKATITLSLISASIETGTSKPTPIGLMDIVIKSGASFTISKTDFLFLPGASLTIEEGATVSVTNSAVDLTFATYSEIQSTGGNRNFANYSTDHNDAYLLCNGTFNCGGSFGGKIITSGENATVKLTSKATSDYVVMNSTASPYYKSGSSKAKMNVYTGSVIGSSAINVSTGTYYSIKDSAGNYGFRTTSGTISYNVNGGSGSYSAKSITIGASGYTISASDVPSTNPTRTHYTFGGWYTDNTFTTQVVGYTTYSGLELYAKWVPVTYTINYVDVYDGNYASGNTSTSSNPTMFTVEDYQALQDATNGDNVFSGWYLDSACTSKIGVLDGSILVNKLSGNAVNLYALWYRVGAQKYTVRFVNGNTNVICAETESIVDDGTYDWTSYSLPDMTAKDNDYTVQQYFDGWYNANGTKVTALNAGMFVDDELVLTARWANKNSMIVSATGIDLMTVYYVSGYSFTVPSLESKGIKLGATSSVLINWIFNDNSTCKTGDRITLTNQTKLTANIVKYITVSIGTNDYTTITVTLTKDTGYTVTLNSTTGVTTATAFDGTTKTNGASFYMTVGSVFNAKYAAKSDSKNNSATISGTSPTTALSTSDTAYTVSSDVTITPSGEDDSSCFATGTLITMADGTQKAIEDIQYGEEIMVWNFFTGRYETRKIALLIYHGDDLYDVLNLEFSDGTTLRTIKEHGLFDYDLNRYVYPMPEDYLDYIGHRFVKYDNATGEYVLVTLDEAYYTQEHTGAYSITSSDTSNALAEGILTVAPPDDFYNWIEMSDKLRYDSEQFAKDVEEYGLYTYDDFKDYVTYETFVAFNGAYLKVAVEKGYFTFERILELIEEYKAWMPL